LKVKYVDINLPEEFFSTDVLKKGISLLKRKKIECISKQQNTFIFLSGAVKRAELHLTITKNLIKNYFCTCERVLCEHLCAAIFYLKKENYEQVSIPDKAKQRRTVTLDLPIDLIEKIESGTVSEALKIINETSLMKRRKLICSFCAYAIHIRKKLSDDELGLFSVLIANARFNKSFANEMFYYLKESLRSNTLFQTEIYFALLPSLIKYLNPFEREEVKVLIKKRKQKIFFPGYLDKKEIAISILSVNNNKKVLSEKTAEYYIALTLLAFANKRTEYGFRILEKGFIILSEKKPVNFSAYTRFILEQAKHHAKKELEINYHKHLLLLEPYVSASQLDRVSQLLSDSEKKTFFDGLLIELKRGREAKEKILEILFHQQRWKDLLEEVKGDRNKFSLLNKIALAMLPVTDSQIIKQYPVFFAYSVNNAGDGHYRTFLFDQSEVFLKRIDFETRERIVTEMIALLGGNHYLSFKLHSLLKEDS
jgi:hypothetical protein